MNATLGEQIISLIATLAAMAMAGLSVYAMVRCGVVMASAYSVFGLTVFVAVRFTIGRSIRPGGARPLAPVTTDDDESEG